MKYCTKCGAQNSDESQICCNCQNPLYTPDIQPIISYDESFVFCTKCGTQNSKDNQVCCNCQNPLFHLQDKTSKSNFSKKNIVICILAIIALVILFVVLISTHIICINHDWDVPTCIEPAKCVYCDKYKDDVLGNHKWTEATCMNAKTCSVCNLKSGEALGHDWQEATCTTPKTCLRCGGNTGTTSEHIEDEWIITQEATLIDEGTETIYCSVCGEFLDSRDIEKKNPEVEYDTFNFTDEELLDWINDKTTAQAEYTDRDLFDSSSSNTSYRITLSDGQKGALILNHDGNDEEVQVIMVWFDDWTSAASIAIWIGEKIDSDFVFDDAAYALQKGRYYSEAGMTIYRLELDTDFEVTLLTPTEYFEDLIS